MIEHHSQVRNQFYNIFDFNFMVLTKKVRFSLRKLKIVRLQKFVVLTWQRSQVDSRDGKTAAIATQYKTKLNDLKVL